MTWCLFLPFQLPGLNEILVGQSGAIKGWSKYNDSKQKLSGDIVLLARRRGLGTLGSGFFTYLLLETSQRRDPSNLVSGAVKIIEDALKVSGYLENDGWAHVLGFVGYWVKSDKGGCLVHWRPDRLASKVEMIDLLEEEEKNGNNVDGFGNAHDEPGHPPHRKTRARRSRARGQLPVR